MGFPGETEEDFEDTMKLVWDVGYGSAYSFRFSARPGTPAAAMKNLVHQKIAEERLARLQALIREQSLAFNKSFEGKTVPVLFDRKGKKPGQLHGRTPWNQSVHVDAGEEFLNRIVTVQVTDGFENSLSGTFN